MWFLQCMGKISWKQKMKIEDFSTEFENRENTFRHSRGKETQNLQPHQMPGVNYEKNPRRQDGGQKTTRQASGSVVQKHQRVVRAMLSRV